MATTFRRDQIAYLYHKRSGTKEEFVAKFGEECYRSLQLIGIISGEQTWQVTSMVDDEYDFYFGSLNEDEKAILSHFSSKD